MIVASAIEQIRKLAAHEIEVEVETIPSPDPRVEISVQAELSDYVFSYRFRRYFHYSELLPLESDDPSVDYALHIPSGLVLCSASCVWAQVWGK